MTEATCGCDEPTSSLMAIVGGYRSGISRESPEKKERGCKPFISLAVNHPVRFRWSLQPVPDGVRVSRTRRDVRAGLANERDIAGSSALRRIAQRCSALYSRHQVRLSGERCVMGRCNLLSYYQRLSAEDRRTFDRWLQANAIFGSIFAVALIAMAFAGSRSIAPRDAAIAGGTTTPFEVGASEQHRTRTKW